MASAAMSELKTRAEVQLLRELNLKKAQSASQYLRDQQQRAQKQERSAQDSGHYHRDSAGDGDGDGGDDALDDAAADAGNNGSLEEEKRLSARRWAARDLKQYRLGQGKNAPSASEQEEMVAAVRQLEQHVTSKQELHELNQDDARTTAKTPTQIERNALQRHERHMAAQRAYTEEVKVISEEIEAGIIQAADAVKEALATVDRHLQQAQAALHEQPRLLQAESNDIARMWAEMEACCQSRSQVITRFASQLNAIECTRIQRVGAGLALLTGSLMATAHALPPEVERVIEAEAYELNVVVISNRCAYAELIARMASADVNVLVETRLAWERGQVRWRQLRHRDAIARFQDTLNSSAFRDPEERQRILQELRTCQQRVHADQRLVVLRQLQEAGAALSSTRAREMLTQLSETQREEEDSNAAFFERLRGLHDAQLRGAEVLRESLRLALHGFGALAPEGDIEACRDELERLLQGDDAQDEFFRQAGGLRGELESVVRRLQLAELVYEGHLTPLRACVAVLRSALPLEHVMEGQGKSAERKALLATLDKMRKAAKHELLALLPTLHAQMGTLLHLEGMDATFKSEVDDLCSQLKHILDENEALVASAMGGGQETFLDGSSVSGSASVSNATSIGKPKTPPLTRATSRMSMATSTSKTLGMAAASSSAAPVVSMSTTLPAGIDLQAIRRVQRRLGMLVSATELSEPFQAQLLFISQQLELQQTANAVVDSAVSASCDQLLASREEESRAFLVDMGARIERQSTALHEQCERLVRFFLQVALTLEASEDRVTFITLSVLDLLDALKDSDDERNRELEQSFHTTCALLRHAPDEGVLRQAFADCNELLRRIDAGYRVYNAKCGRAARHHVVATQRQQDVSLAQLCELFALHWPPHRRREEKTATSPLDDVSIETLLSVQYIDELVDATSPRPASASGGDGSGGISSATAAGLQASGESPTEQQQQQQATVASGQEAHEKPTASPSPSASASPASSRPPSSKAGTKRGANALPSTAPQPERFETKDGSVFTVKLDVAALVTQLLSQHGSGDGDGEDGVSGEQPLLDAASSARALEPEPSTASAEGEQMETEEEEEDPAIQEARHARELRLRQVSEMVETAFLTLTIDQHVLQELVHCFRGAAMNQFEAAFRSHLAQAQELLTQRQHAATLLLDERLRMHWPRRGRLDVQFYQPRIGELHTHRQRQERQVRAMVKKVEAQEQGFRRQVQALTTSMEDVRVRQLALQVQLPMQLSLAALQGLEAKSKKLLSVCRADSDDRLARLRALTVNDMSTLSASAQEYIRTCSAQLFPDLSSEDVIAGCDYHPMEVEVVRAAMTELEATLGATFADREQQVNALAETQHHLLESAHEFKARYQSCLQSLSMKEGLGQKYGLPRRTAQERYRSETTRCDENGAALDALLTRLQTLVAHRTDKKKKKNGSASKRSADGEEEEEEEEEESGRKAQAQQGQGRGDTTTQILHVLLQLRLRVYHRGQYFGFLKNVSQLEPVPITYDAGGVEGRAVVTDRALVDSEFHTAATPFLTFVGHVAAKCREETRLLYQSEGKLEELPESGVPAALDDYLAAQSEKARAYVIQQELQFRAQVDLLGELLALAPEVALADLVARAERGVTDSTRDLMEALERQYAEWMTTKDRHAMDLRPELCSVNNAAQLRVVCEREAERAEQTLHGLRAVRLQLVTSVISFTSDFERELLALVQTFAVILDTTVMTLEDLTPFTGEELPKLKRKSLKRLRKMARIQEVGDSREVARSEDELRALALNGEVPRFPRRAWPGVPRFGMHEQWHALRQRMQQEDVAMLAPLDEALDAMELAPATSSDGSCCALLTHAHRCLMHSRDEMYATFSGFVVMHIDKLLANLQERLRDEIKWTESWQMGVDKVRQQGAPPPVVDAEEGTPRDADQDE